MNPGALYAELIERPERVHVRHHDGALRPLPLARWLGRCTGPDELVAASVAGPVLDIGCGPGRLLEALARHGVWALGVDLSPAAVRVARRRGRRAVLGCVFADVPGAGHWRSALLLDGNVGIGGDPAALLRRVRELLVDGGTIVAEVDPPGTPTRGGRVRLETGAAVSDWFEWASVGADGVASVGASAGLAVNRTASVDGRWFAWLA